MKNTRVTVFCPTYNQEKYIGEAIKSIVVQKTNFPFEAIVYDDCSTDSTRKIIERFEKEYPDIVRPIYSPINNWSKDIDVLYNYVLPNTESDYIAFCDGDDFWIDDYKLQKQFDALEKNSNCSICVHGVNGCDRDGEANSYYRPKDKFNVKHKNHVISQQEIANMIFNIGKGTALPFQTSSYFVRKKAFDNYYSNNWMVGGRYDTQFLRSSLACGDFYFINETMSTYRVNSIGSVNTKAINEGEIINARRLLQDAEDDISFDSFTNFMFHDDIMNEAYHILSFSQEYAQNEANSFYIRNHMNLKKMREYIGTYKTARFVLIKKFPNLFRFLKYR